MVYPDWLHGDVRGTCNSLVVLDLARDMLSKATARCRHFFIPTYAELRAHHRIDRVGLNIGNAPAPELVVLEILVRVIHAAAMIN